MTPHSRRARRMRAALALPAALLLATGCDVASDVSGRAATPAPAAATVVAPYTPPETTFGCTADRVTVRRVRDDAQLDIAAGTPLHGVEAGDESLFVFSGWFVRLEPRSLRACRGNRAAAHDETRCADATAALTVNVGEPIVVDGRLADHGASDLRYVETLVVDATGEALTFAQTPEGDAVAFPDDARNPCSTPQPAPGA